MPCVATSSGSNLTRYTFFTFLFNKYIYKLRYRVCLRYPIEADDLAEFVEFPDVVAVGAELPELEALLALGLVAVRAHAAGVVVAACSLVSLS